MTSIKLPHTPTFFTCRFFVSKQGCKFRVENSFKHLLLNLKRNKKGEKLFSTTPPPWYPTLRNEAIITKYTTFLMSISKVWNPLFFSKPKKVLNMCFIKPDEYFKQPFCLGSFFYFVHCFLLVSMYINKSRESSKCYTPGN